MSATYGAGGSWLGPRLAESLGVPFYDRAIPTAVAERLDLPLEHAMHHDESPAGVLDRFAHMFIFMVPVADTTPEATLGPSDVRRETERVIRELADSGRGVILGRAAAIVLRDHPGALHVRLDGPPRQRVAQAMRLGGLEAQAAERARQANDRAREAYAKSFYGLDPSDPSLYHLVVDSTAVALEAVREMVLSAVRGRAR